jgi:hypothetical protein
MSAPKNIREVEGGFLDSRILVAAPQSLVSGKETPNQLPHQSTAPRKGMIMLQSASSRSTIGAKTIVASLETISVETRRELPRSGGCIENCGGRRDVSGGLPAPQKKGWSYFVFCRELQTLLERGREAAVRIGGTSVLL